MAKARKKVQLGRGLSSLLKDNNNNEDQQISAKPDTRKEPAKDVSVLQKRIAELEHQLRLKDIKIKHLKSSNKSLKETNKFLNEGNEAFMRMNDTQLNTISNLINASFVDATNEEYKEYRLV